MTDTITATTEGEQHSGDGERSPSGTLEHINPQCWRANFDWATTARVCRMRLVG